MVGELNALAHATPDGSVLAAVERQAVDRGCGLVRDRLQEVLNAQAEGLEKKGGVVRPVPAADLPEATARPSGGWFRRPGR
jgi:hypothetical protein